MTKRDYVLLSSAMRRALNRAVATDQRGVILAARELAHTLAERNPRFETQRFLTDSGVELCENC